MTTVVGGPPVVIGLVARIEATLLLMQTTKFLARVSLCYEFDLAAVQPDPPQLPRLRSFALDFPSRLFVVVHEETISLVVASTDRRMRSVMAHEFTSRL
jgi:hypothetical protein